MVTLAPVTPVYRVYRAGSGGGGGEGHPEHSFYFQNQRGKFLPLWTYFVNMWDANNLFSVPSVEQPSNIKKKHKKNIHWSAPGPLGPLGPLGTLGKKGILDCSTSFWTYRTSHTSSMCSSLVSKD